MKPANPSFEKTCRNCGHCEDDARNPAKMGICHDEFNIQASPVGKTEKVVRLWQTCSNWTPRNCQNCQHSPNKEYPAAFDELCERICKDNKIWKHLEAEE